MLQRLLIVCSMVLAILFVPVGAEDKSTSSSEVCWECDGKISNLTLQYHGERSALIKVYGHKGDIVFDATVSPNAFFTLNGFDKKNTLGPKVKIYIDSVLDTEIHTSCSVALLLGMQFGSFTIVDGDSRNGGQTCSISDFIPSGHLCGSVYEDTNGNGLRDNQESSTEGIQITVTDVQNSVSSVLTDTDGDYCAYNISEGLATIEVDTTTLPIGTELFTGENPNSVTILANTVNNAGLDGYAYLKPTAFEQNITTQEDTPISITLQAEDKSGRVLTYLIETPPSNGLLSGTAPNLTYTPNADYYGTDSFTFVVNNGILSSEVATVNILITPVNDAPVAVDDNVTTLENVSIAIKPLLNDTDIDGNSSKLRIISISQPSFGTVFLSEEFVYYAPNSHNELIDYFNYTIEDEYGARDTATITINITLVNEPPIAYNQIVYTDEDTPISIELNATDLDGDELNYTITYQPENGVVTGIAPHLTYTPDSNYSGNDYIAYMVNDGEYDSYVAVVTIVVNPLNDPPIANAGEDYIGIRGDTVVFNGSDSYDIDGNIMSYEWSENNIILSTEKIFDRQILQEGVHTVTLIVTDDNNATDSDEKIITITPCCVGCNYPDPTQTNPYN